MRFFVFVVFAAAGRACLSQRTWKKREGETGECARVRAREEEGDYCIVVLR